MNARTASHGSSKPPGFVENFLDPQPRQAKHAAMPLTRFIRWFGRRSVHAVGFYSLMAGCAAAGFASVGDIPWWVDGAILTAPILLWIVCAWAIQAEARN